MTENLQEMLERAREAQKVVEFWSQEKVDEMVLAVGWEAYKRETAETCARMAVDETGLGVYEDKLSKHQKKTLGVVRDLQGVKTVGVIERIPRKRVGQDRQTRRCYWRDHTHDEFILHHAVQRSSDPKNTECGDLRTASQSQEYLRLHLHRNAQGT